MSQIIKYRFNPIFLGETARLVLPNVVDVSGNPIISPTAITLKIIRPDNSTYGSFTTPAISNDGSGNFHYDFNIPSTEQWGQWTSLWTVVNGSSTGEFGCPFQVSQFNGITIMGGNENGQSLVFAVFPTVSSDPPLPVQGEAWYNTATNQIKVFNGTAVEIIYPVSVSGIAGLPFVTVTPNGPNDGGNYGSNTPGTTTGGIMEAINAVQGTTTPVYISGAITATGAITIPDNTEVWTIGMSYVILSQTLTIGHKNSNSFRVSVHMRLAPTAGFTPNTQLVDVYNVQQGGTKDMPDVEIELAGTNTNINLFAVHSTNGLGMADGTYRVTTGSSYQTKNGILIMNGDATTPSIGTDFCNGALFIKSDMNVTNNALQFWSLSPAGGVGGNIARNTFFRCDWFGYTGAGIINMSGPANVSQNHFFVVTLEPSVWPGYDIDMTTNSSNGGGQFWMHMICHAVTTQRLNPRDRWMWSEGDPIDYIGGGTPVGDQSVFAAQASAFKGTNRQVGANASYTTSSTAAVSTGIGTSAIAAPSFGEVRFTAFCDGYNSNTSDGWQALLYRSTIGVPAAGSTPAVGDVTVWGSSNFTQEGAGSVPQTTGVIRFDGPLLTNIPYYYYFAVRAITGGNATISNTTLIVEEN